MRVVRSPKSVHVHHVHRMIFSDTFIRKTMKFNDETFTWESLNGPNFRAKPCCDPTGLIATNPSYIYVSSAHPACVRFQTEASALSRALQFAPQ